MQIFGRLNKHSDDENQHLCSSLEWIPKKRRSKYKRALPSQGTPSKWKTQENRTTLWTRAIPHLMSLPPPARVSCSTETEQPVALSRFMSYIIIGNIRHLLGHTGRWERREGAGGERERDGAGWRRGETGGGGGGRENQQRTRWRGKDKRREIAGFW